MTNKLLVRTRPGYHLILDPWGHKLQCSLLDDATVAFPTDRLQPYNNGYSTDPVHVWEDSITPRNWLQIHPIDYGGRTSFIETTTREFWVEFYPAMRLVLPDDTPITSEAQLRQIIGLSL
jgi:hypothetical protein